VFCAIILLSGKPDHRTNKGQKMNIVWETVKQDAKAELDRIWAILTEASNFHKNSIGKMGEQFAYENAMEINAVYETTKAAYKAIGLKGSIGIHNI
jgi:predicted ATPase